MLLIISPKFRITLNRVVSDLEASLVILLLTIIPLLTLERSGKPVILIADVVTVSSISDHIASGTCPGV